MANPQKTSATGPGLRLLVGPLWLLLPLGCASGPDLDRAVELAPKDQVAVVYQQPRTEFTQTMMTETVVRDAVEFYSAGTDRFSKVLSPAGMQLLLDGMATVGFFEHAGSVPSPGAAAHLLVRVNDRAWAWSATPDMPLDERSGFTQCLVTFQNVYNATEAFHSSVGDNDVLQEHERIRQRNERLSGDANKR